MTRPQRYTPAEERALITASQAGRTRCRDMLVASLGGLVEAGARRYSGRYVEFEDLLQAGYAGLVEAINLFDPERSVESGAFFYHRIRAACRAAATGALGPGPKQKFNRPASSLNVPVLEGSDLERIDFLPSNEPAPDVVCEENDTLQRLRASLAELPKRDRQVIEISYYRDAEDEYARDSYRQMGISAEGARLVRRRALKRLEAALAA